jgi:hypothetical protein
VRRIEDTSRFSPRGGAEPIGAPRSTTWAMGVSAAVLRRWVDRGFIPTAGSIGLPDQRFTGFPPLLVQELPVVAVEAVD